ncbi:MAG: hypothetical protein JSV97_06825 [candidate division WOR-3 bacterium]|nr:MAG: hypothetical protein JSV97_06825 [candidate division WOR-3 bacterium]
MKRVVAVCFFVILVLVFVRATCGKVRPPIGNPVEVIKIKDYVYYHNVSITYNGKNYFTINGGNDDYCIINEYDKGCKFIKSCYLGVDGRVIFYNPNDGELCVKIFGTNVYKLDLNKEVATVSSMISLT